MANIYQISQDLLSIFDEIEDNEGELTPELEEKLNITEETFKDKIESYSNVIKMLNSDIEDIKKEINRLKELQQSKDKTITRLKHILITAIEQFGNTTKAGGKYIDYGTGKVSVKYSKSIDVNEADTNRFIDRLLVCAKWYADNNQLSENIVKPDDIIDYINDKSITEEEDDVEISEFTLKDIDKLKASIDLDIDINSLISTKTGIDLLRALLEYNVFKVKCTADKKALKDAIKEDENYVPSYARLITNKSVTIK